MAIYDTTAGFTNAFNGAQNVTDTFRKNMAFKALEKTYGPIVGDMKLATDVQAYEQSELTNPLEVEQKQLTNAGLARTNAFNAANDPLTLKSNEIANEQGQFNLDKGKSDADKAETIRQAQEAHTTLTGVLDTVETQLNGVVDPDQRLAVFDDQVRQIAPLIGADPEQLLHSLAQQRAAVAAQGTAAIGPMRKQLDDMLYAGLDPEERQKLKNAALDAQLKTAQIGATDALTLQREAAAKKAANGGDAATPEGVTMAIDQLERTVEGVTNLDDLIDDMSDVGLVRKGKALVPGSAEYNFVTQAQSAAVQGGLQALQALSDAGVSLSPMSDTDFKALINSVANLDVGQSKGQLRGMVGNLRAQTKRALDIIKKKKAAMDEAASDDSGEADADADDGEAFVEAADYFKVP